MPVPSLTRGASSRGALWQASARGVRRTLGVLVVPAVLAVLVLRYLVPPMGSGVRGDVAVLGHRYTLPFGVALFLLFSALARYWLRRLSSPGVEETPATEAVATPARASRRWREALGVVATLAGAACVALALRAWVVQPYRVLGASMLPTLEPDDLVAGTKTRYGRGGGTLPRRGDVVVFRASAVAMDRTATDVPEVLVKRVVGLPGDRVAMRGGAPVINGWPVPTCDAGEYLYLVHDGRSLHGRLRVEFLDDRAYLTVHAVAASFTEAYTVKPGEVFVLGDDRGNSVDSRAYDRGRGGGVPVDAIEARARWFLAGTHRSGETDLGRIFRPVDTLQTRLRLEGLETRRLEEGIARCLAGRPTETHPPPNSEPTATRTL
jgi:signal peptidase I